LGKADERQNKRQDWLVKRLRAGNHTAAVELVELYYRRIYLYMRRLGHSVQVSEDITQESFLQAWHHIGQLKDGRALNGWLYRIAGNASKHYWRRYCGRKAIGLEGLVVEDNKKVEHHDAELSEELQRLKTAVSELPFKLREAVVLHYMQNLTITEAAQAAGVREGTFKSRLGRALEILRKDFLKDNE